MAYFVKSAKCIFNASLATILYFLLYVQFEWSIGFDYLWTIVEGHFNGWQNKFVLVCRSEHTFIVALDAFAHDYDMINKKLLN